MSRPVSIPNPVVGIKRMATVVVYLSVESAVILSVFAQVDRAFIATVQRGIKDSLVVLCSSRHLDFT